MSELIAAILALLIIFYVACIVKNSTRILKTEKCFRCSYFRREGKLERGSSGERRSSHYLCIKYPMKIEHEPDDWCGEFRINPKWRG